MDGDSGGDGKEKNAEGPVGGDEDGAVEEGEPDEGDGEDFDVEWDGLMDHEIGYVGAELGMVHEPVIKVLVAAEEEEGGEQEEGGCGEDRQENAEDSQSQRN